MKLRVYMNDWSINMGIVGFLNILKDTDMEHQVVKKDNYIEFDSEILENFQNYYFSYFMKEYDVSERLRNNIQYNLSYLKKNEDKIKDIMKRIKESIKYQGDKVKKFDDENFKLLKEKYDAIGNIKSFDKFDEVEKLCNECVDIFKINHINEKLTLNLYKYIVGDNYFGQVSFFNVAKSSLDLQGLKRVMYNDYLLSIIYYCKLQDYIESNDINSFKIWVEESLKYFSDEVKAKTISKNSIKTIEKILKEINKLIKKEKCIVDIKNYLDTLDGCHMCGDIKGIVDNYTESDFVPLAVSADNSRNMYWNMDVNFPICDLCKLMLFCTPAGATLIRKRYITNEENEFYSFVNMDTSINDLCNKNHILKINRDRENPFKELIVNIVEENEEKSRWQLENILFVEFKASVDAKKCKMNYLNMPTYLAKFLSKETKILNSIKDVTLKASIIDIILKEKDLKFLINDKLREQIPNIVNSNKNSNKSFYTSSTDMFRTINIRYILSCYKKGGLEKVDDKKLKAIRYAGRDIHDYYVLTNSENKLEGIAYRLLNTAKVRNKKDFMDIILRLFMNSKKKGDDGNMYSMSVPMVFLDAMSEKDLDFESIAYAFISGLISNKNEPKKNESETGEVK
ncbi:type I-B CRISPR-associated protein Cas8b1/Cst1 [Terrisporobacter sp.]